MKFKSFFLFFVILFSSKFSVAQDYNKLDANGKRHGLWKKFHPNKRIRYIGTFEHGKEKGIFKYYDIRSSKYPAATREFSPISDIVWVKFYTLEGKLRSKGKMKGKNRIGKWIYYFPNGNLFSEESYKDGKLDGILTDYYSNKKVLQTIEYKNGKKEGLHKKYSDDGVLLEEITYQNNIANGLAKYYNTKGQIKEVGVYKQGRKHGKWLYYIDGEVISEKDKKKLNSYKKN